MKSVFKKLKVMFLIFAMLISNSSAIILASNSGDVGTSGNTEVTNNLDDNLSNANGGGDTLFGAVPPYNVGDTIWFGTYPQNSLDNNIVEPIKWRVLSNDGQKALLVSDKILDFKHYHNVSAEVSWATCDLRNWLNNTFYNKAFNTTEKSVIKKETIQTAGSVDTQDNVFLLSSNEAQSLFSNDNDRRAQTTYFARHVEVDGLQVNGYYNFYTKYWLRSQADGDPLYADLVSDTGNVSTLGHEVEDTWYECAVRPAIYINLQSSYCQANESSITYNLDGGAWVKDSITWKDMTKYKEGEVNALPTANEVKKDGYVFKGWSINGSVNPEISITTSFTGNLLIKALWQQDDNRDLTDREKAAYIVRDEWTNWVNSFTGELKELDKNATSRIYNNMDFYDMQYRFTEKYKKVPEYLDEDGKPTEKLKKLISEKRKELAGGAKKIKDYLKFTANENGSTVHFRINNAYGSNLNYDLGYSKDGLTFTKWYPEEVLTLNAGEYIYIHNKTESLSKDNAQYLYFRMTGSIAASGNIMSLLNFAEEVPSHGFYGLFTNCAPLTTAPELPSLIILPFSYAQMFAGCSNLKEAPILPVVNVPLNAYESMFYNCTSLEKVHIKAKYIADEYTFYRMFWNCSSLNTIKLDYTGEINFNNWVRGVTGTGTLYYNGPTTEHGISKIPTNFTVVPFTD